MKSTLCFLWFLISLPAFGACDPTITLTVPELWGSEPTIVRANATSGCAVSAMHVYVDAKLIYKQSGQNRMETRLLMGPGPHRVTIKAWNTAGAMAKQEGFVVTEDLMGEPPMFCSPDGGRPLVYTGDNIARGSPPEAQHLSPVEVGMVADMGIATFSSMRLYVDGVNRAQVWGSSAWCLPYATRMYLKPGYHFITVQAWDTEGRIYFDGSVVHVTESLPPVLCPVPASAGVRICSPLDGLTFAQSTLEVRASAASSVPIKVMELWIDGTKQQVWLNQSQINHTANLSAGEHLISVWATDQNNQKFNQRVRITIEAD